MTPAPTNPSDLRVGIIYGVVMAFSASISFAVARGSILQGVWPADLVLARFVFSGLVMLPFLIRWGIGGLAGIGWRRSLILIVFGGPIFSLLQTGGLAYAPLAHAAVIAPSTVTILSMAMAALFLRERLGATHFVGAFVVVIGIVTISWHGLTGAEGGSTWRGDLMFFGSGVMWSGFTILMRRWRLDAVKASVVVAVLSMVLMIPIYWVGFDVGHLADIPLVDFAYLGLIQGGLQGIISVIAYNKSVVLLGVSRAVLFPATVPAMSVLVGIPIVGEYPTGLQVVGLVTVTVGLLITTGYLGRVVRSLTRR